MTVAPCPHCQYRVTLTSDGPPQPCPQCGAAVTVTRPPTPAAAAGTYAQTPDQAAVSAAMTAEHANAVPGYEILNELGRGGMGVVYKARDTRLNREVALKMILNTDARRATIARFWAEAEVMAAVKHPNVVQVYELGESGGRPFMAMEFVTGGSLDGRLKGGVLSPREAAELLAKVAAGVGAAHELGIVHRDLKPGNVMLDADGEPKVMDFGIAKRKSHELTQTNAMMGTPAYMSPEQAASQSRHVGPAADVWSLGVVLYECLSGKRPFAGDTVFDILAKIATEEPPPLRTLTAGILRDLQTIVTKCLTKEPELRYPTAAELADDLERFTRGEPIAARPVGLAERVARWIRRKPTAAAAWGLSSLAVLLAAVVFVVFGFWRDAEEANDQLAKEKKQTEAARDLAEGLFRDADNARGEAEKQRGIAQQAQKDVEREREKLAVFEYGRTMQVAHQEWRDNNIVATRALLDGTKPELRGWEWRYLHRISDSSLLTLKGHTGIVFAAAFSPDGTRLVTASWDRTAKVWDARTGAEVLTLKGHTEPVIAAAFSSDGTRLVTASGDGTAKVWDAAPFTGTPLPLAPSPRPKP